MRASRLGVFVLMMGLLVPLALSAATLKVGDRAPNFTLKDQNWHDVTLGQFRGKQNVVLAFYVLAFTSG